MACFVDAIFSVLSSLLDVKFGGIVFTGLYLG